MTWNWQRPDWPDFSWDEKLLRKAEGEFLVGSGVGPLVFYWMELSKK